jgi:hypothetical protein
MRWINALSSGLSIDTSTKREFGVFSKINYSGSLTKFTGYRSRSQNTSKLGY